jgi:hypothetical protein
MNNFDNLKRFTSSSKLLLEVMEPRKVLCVKVLQFVRLVRKNRKREQVVTEVAVEGVEVVQQQVLVVSGVIVQFKPLQVVKVWVESIKATGRSVFLIRVIRVHLLVRVVMMMVLVPLKLQLVVRLYLEFIGATVLIVPIRVLHTLDAPNVPILFFQQFVIGVRMVVCVVQRDGNVVLLQNPDLWVESEFRFVVIRYIRAAHTVALRL